MIPLAVPNLTGNEKKYLDDCIDTTFVSSVGEYVNRFEKMIAEATGSKFAVATSAGTTGLHVALTAVGVKHGDLVILPSFTFIASANSIAHCGAAPWLMDIESTTWCLDPTLVHSSLERECEKQGEDLIHKASGRRVAAIMPVYTLGNIPDMQEFRVIADEYKLPLVADAACAIGATNGEFNIGSLADLSVLSFNGNKTITCGGGGAVVGNDERLTSLVRHLTTTARIWPDYDFDMVGFNYRMTNVQAAIGCAQMESLNQFIARKREIRLFYEDRLSGLKENGYDFFPTTDGSSCWFSGIVLPKGTILDDLKRVCSALKEFGIEGKTFWKPVHLQKPYKDAPRVEMSISEELWERVLTLPCSTGISAMELDAVAKIVSDILA